MDGDDFGNSTPDDSWDDWSNGWGTESDNSHSTDPNDDWGSTSGSFFD